LLVLGGLAFALLVAEVGIRAHLAFTRQSLYDAAAEDRAPNGSAFTLNDLIVPSRNPRLVYELVPDRSGTYMGFPYRTNSFGMRGREMPREKPDKVFRVATLGDSTMFGWGVHEADSYPSTLEAALNLAGDPWRYEVLNFAVPGYNTAMEVEMFESRAKAFSPDLIVIQFCASDLSLPNFIFDPPNLLSLRRSYLLTFVTNRLARFDTEEALDEIVAPRLRDAPSLHVESPLGLIRWYEYRSQFAPERYRYMVGWEGVIRALDRLWAATDRPILHISFNITRDWNDIASKDQFGTHVRAAGLNEDKGRRLFYRDVRAAGQQFCETQGLDLLGALSVAFPSDCHPSSERHQFIAQAIYRSLVENRALPAGSAHYETSETVDRWFSDRAEAMWKRRSTLQSDEPSTASR
jgi:lysophospholipase L1-like esterase